MWERGREREGERGGRCRGREREGEDGVRGRSKETEGVREGEKGREGEKIEEELDISHHCIHGDFAQLEWN